MDITILHTGRLKKGGAKNITRHSTSQCTYYEVQLSIVHLIIKKLINVFGMLNDASLKLVKLFFWLNYVRMYN